MIDYRVYLVTDDPSRYAGDWLENVEAAVAGGVTCVQYRDTQSTRRVQYERASALKKLLARTRTPLVVNDDVALAMAVEADGVHVGQNDLPPLTVRRLVGPRMEIGLSITNLAQLAAVPARCVNCLGVGPVYDATRTKRDAAPEMGPAGLKDILDAAGDVPIVAIGGITLERAPGIARTGVGGLAVVSAISQAADPFAAARRLRALFG